jgi:imidazolonepropionase-like amidohydrolase
MVLWNARLIDGSGGPPRNGVCVELDGGSIRSVAAAHGDPPEGAVELAGRTLMPGLIDAHMHVSSDVSRSPGFGPAAPLHGELPRPRELGYFVLAQTAAALLAAGITSVRDVGCYDGEAIVLREAIRLKLLDGPLILSCGASSPRPRREARSSRRCTARPTERMRCARRCASSCDAEPISSS